MQGYKVTIVEDVILAYFLDKVSNLQKICMILTGTIFIIVKKIELGKDSS